MRGLTWKWTGWCPSMATSHNAMPICETANMDLAWKTFLISNHRILIVIFFFRTRAHDVLVFLLREAGSNVPIPIE